jgi:hypothetical protein
MIAHEKLLAALLAFAATAGTAEAQRLSPGYDHGPRRAGVSLSFGNPYFSRSRHRAPRRVWVPGHMERVQRRVWVEGGYRREWVAPVYDTRLVSCGRVETLLVRQGHWTLVEQPGHFETRQVEVWVDGYWRSVGR